ncbi:hypothetical protein [Ramlibacter sp. 2FC]|uniref:hypothetical protein n=1 Tax=Ramlibacter sp. 2FC TaxID=2502188 RepID=UPI0010F4F155|nr:hypothetical protein [Ramlibacter sp. 2FC]
MSNRPSKPGPASEWPGFPSAAAANPLADIAPLVALATNLAVPDSHAAPDDIDALIAMAASLAPPDTPVGEGGGGGGGASALDAITSNGVQLGAGAQHALASAAQANAAAGLEMTLQADDEVFLITVGIGHAIDAVL